nr:protein FAR1-RELATED SEQUENCE 5-like [Setaria viridis]
METTNSALINGAVDARQGNSTAIIESASTSVSELPESMAQQSDTVLDKNGQPLIAPEVGMAFDSEDKAYEMYNNYAGKKDATRTGCDARVQFSVSREGIWKVQKVVLDHNHYLASPNKKHKLKSQRRVTDADRQLIGQIREAGMKPAQVYEFMKEFYGGSDKVPFAKMDSNNEIGRERKKYLECNDAQSLLDYLKNKQRDDPGFFYAAQIDEEDGWIANFFWADGQSIMDYACFGDAVSFDTTFQTNKFEMPFAPLLGTNHHKQTIIFGAALIFNESIESFVWLFETFLTAMSGKHPKTIFTDQDAAMAGAIAYRCVYEERSEPLFIQMWQKLLSKYKLENNQWMANLYALRKKWATIYRDSFTADMNSTQRSEGMNNVFKKRFRRKLGLTELLVECEKVSASLRENELEADFNSRQKNPVTYSPDLPLLKSAAESYTKRMYLEFEEEFKEHFSFSCKLLQADESILTYMKVYCASMPSKFSV